MSSPGQGQSAASTTEVLAATIAAVVERQLTQYVSTMVKQVEAAKATAEQGKAELRAEFRAQLDELMAQQGAALHQMQNTLESRLAEFSHQQQYRLNEVENRLLEIPGGSGGDSAEVAALKDQMDSQSAAAHARIDDLQRATRRFDEQAAALVQHVNDTTVALAQRMDEGNQQLAAAVEERLGFVRTTLERVGPEVQRQLTDQATNLAQRLDFVEHKITDRMLTMEDRVNEQNGVKIAAVEAAVGRISSGFDDAIGAMSHRLLGIENRQEELVLHLEALRQQVSKVDEDAIQEVKDQVSAAVGEAMLVRIEMDRVKDTLEEKFDKSALRMAEIEALLADEMDVSAAVQLERLEELERAIAELNPDQFVRKTDPTATGRAPLAGLSLPSTSLGSPSASAPAGGSAASGPANAGPSEPSLSSF